MRYHFHVVDQKVSVDAEVADLEGYEQAVDRTRQLARKLIRKKPYAEDPSLWEVAVTDDNGKEVLSLSLSEVSP